MTEKYAIIGLGKMGGGMATQGLQKGHEVVGYTLGAPSADLLKAGLAAAPALGDLKRMLPAPRIVFAFVPAGKAVDELINNVYEVLEPGDIFVDGGNSYWGDSIRRYHRLKERGLGFVDMGTSGGPEGAKHGACFMCGGEAAVVNRLRPLLEDLSVPGGFVHCGPPGAGHFVKLVHNGIEFGMMQAIGEGLSLLEKYPEKIDIGAVLETWRHGTVIRSWLIDLLAHSYQNEDGLKGIEGYVEDTGEVNWLVEDAARMEVPIPAIAQSVWQLMQSRDKDPVWAKAIAAMRHGFGGHPYGPDEAIARLRKTSRDR